MKAEALFGSLSIAAAMLAFALAYAFLLSLCFSVTGCGLWRPEPLCRWSCGCNPMVRPIERMGPCDALRFDEWCASACVGVVRDGR